jgi:predicted TIM-barrel fold metal-dependent hydrolase
MSTYRGPIVDVDVHNLPASPNEIAAYLPERWRDYRSFNPPPPISIGGIGYSTPAPHVRRSDGGPPGSSYEILKEELLDPNNYYKAILTHNIGQYPDLANQYFMVDVCRAANNWMVEKWLPLDERLASVIIVPIPMIEEAVAEVHRLGDHPQMVGILFAANPLRRPYGDPLYHPIYGAALEHGLALTTHVGIDHTSTSPGGPPATVMANASAYAAMAAHHISSFITHGVFEKFPDAKFVLKEYGIGWLPGLIWRLDAEYERLRIESPWVKRWPSEYIHDHVRLSTQPLETGARRRDLGDYLSVIDGIEDILCFSSDYPHPSLDDHMFVAGQLPAAWHRKVFCDNACTTYGWTPPVGAEPQPVGSAT